MNKEKLKGFTPSEVARKASISRASVYNWLNGRGPYVGLIIEPVIQKLLKIKEDAKSNNHGCGQELELEGSIQNPS